MNPHRACLPRRTVVTAAFLCILTNGGSASTIQVHGAHDPGIEIISECDQLTISVKCPVKGLVLSTPGEGVASCRDDGFDVVPGHVYTKRPARMSAQLMRHTQESNRNWQGGKVCD